ncbi:MAG: MFS transporter [Clostridia bacterium]|nr:MFS transporter [Clostridia bacterium]
MKKTLTVTGLLLLMVIIGTQLSGYQYSTIYINEEYALTNTEIGLLSMMQFIPMLIMPILFGGAIDRYDKRLLAILCAVCYFSGSLIIFLFRSTISLIIGIFVNASGGSMAPAIVTVLLAEINPAKEREYTSFVEASYSSGLVLAPLLLGFLIGKGIMDWRGVFLIASIMSVVSVVLLTVSRAEPVKKLEKAKNANDRFRLDFVIVMLILFGLIYTMMEIGFTTYSALYFMELFDYELGARLSVSLVGFAMVVSKLASARFRSKKENTLIFCALSSLVVNLFMVIFPGKILSVIWCVLFGLVAGPCWPTLMSTALERYYSNAGRITTIILLGSGIGGIVVSPIMGILIDAIGVRLSYIIVSVCALLAAVTVILILLDDKKKKAADLS